MNLRLSLIDFLNAIPLQWGFTQGSARGRFRLLFDVPSQCARHLRQGQADIGLIPVIEYQRIPSLSVLPGISIASKREVKSVIFVSGRPMPEVKRIAVDTSSRTSVALLRILLNEFYGNPQAEFVPRRPDPQGMLEEFDAALIIGNPALRVDTRGRRVYDLANEWYRFTGLPFVFAFWALRRQVDLGEDAACFYQSRRQGLRDLPRISRRYAAKLGLSVGEVYDYLSRNLDYSLDQDNLRGLETYYRLAAKWDLIDTPRPLDMVPLTDEVEEAALLDLSKFEIPALDADSPKEQAQGIPDASLPVEAAPSGKKQ
ncbi:MAG TPA: menaquinone biosynthesis protein [Acidobacteriota bacterium]|nr:menaquinone biosynthesis protein [Acidobacteriota bacterium]